MNSDAYITGVGATIQGKHPDKTAWDLGVDALELALDDAGLTRSDLDGLLTQETQDGSEQMEVARFGQIVGLNPRVSGSLRYGTAGYTLAFAVGLIASGQAESIACVYATNQKTGGYRFRRPLLPEWGVFGAYNPATMAALGFNRYVFQHDQDPDKLGAIALTQRENAALNPIAARQQQLTWDDYLSSRYVTWPLRLLDICSISDGGVALIVTNETIARSTRASPVRIAGIGRQDRHRMLQNTDHLLLPHLRDVAAETYRRADIGPESVDAFYVQDPHSPMVIWALEGFGFCGTGEGLDFIQDGAIGVQGELPVNPSGGQLSEGYMVGWLHQVDAVRQLRGQAGARQVKDCDTTLFCASGGFREYSIGMALTRE